MSDPLREELRNIVIRADSRAFDTALAAVHAALAAPPLEVERMQTALRLMSEPTDSLDAAWAAAMASLPAEWEHLTVRLHQDGRKRVAYEAAAGPYADEEHEYAFGRTPTDALRELAHRLAVKR